MGYNKNGIRYLTDKYLSEIRRGCNSVNCPPSKIPTSSLSHEGLGVTVERLSKL